MDDARPIAPEGGAGTDGGEGTGATRRSFRQNVTWAVAGNAFYLASQWGLLLILTRATTAGDVGRYGLALAVTAPVFAFAQLQLRSVLAADVHRKHQPAVYSALRVGLSVAGWVGVVMVGGWAFPGPAAWIIAAVATMKAVENVSELCWALFQRDERMDLVACAMGWKGVLTLGLAGVGAVATGSAGGVVAGALLAWVATAVWYDLPHARRREPGLWSWAALDGAAVRALARATLPLGAVTALLSLAVSAPRYAIEMQMGSEALGYFTAVSYLPMAAGVLVIAVAQAASPRFAQLHARGRALGPLLWQLCAGAVGVAAVGSMAAWVAGGWALRLLYTPSYAPYARLLSQLFAAAAPGFVAAIVVSGLFAVGEYRGQLAVVSLMTGVAVVASWAWVPAYGLGGAAAAVAVASTVQCAGYLALLTRRLRSPMPPDESD